jgi:hypothetical protein
LNAFGRFAAIMARLGEAQSSLAVLEDKWIEDSPNPQRRMVKAHVGCL